MTDDKLGMNGNVGIGIYYPPVRLDISGTIYLEGD